MIDRLLSHLVEYLERIATPRTLGVLSFLLAAAVALLILSPLSPSRQVSVASGGVGLLDVELFYTPEHAYEMVTAYGARGRAIYLRSLVAVDIVVPIVVNLFLGVALSLMLRRGVPHRRRLHALGLAPLLALLADYAENLGIAAMLLVYPARLDGLALATALMTLVKAAVTTSVIGLILGLPIVIAATSCPRFRAGRPEPRT